MLGTCVSIENLVWNKFSSVKFPLGLIYWYYLLCKLVSHWLILGDSSCLAMFWVFLLVLYKMKAFNDNNRNNNDTLYNEIHFLESR